MQDVSPGFFLWCIMTRARYDTTCDLYYGPNGLVPNTKYAMTDCRVVPLFTELPQVYPFSLRVAYITMALRPNQPKCPGVLPTPALDWSFADTIAVPTGAVPNYQVLLTEQMLWRRQAVYYRTLVSSLVGPPPPVPIWRDTFTEISNTLLDVHVPNLGSGGYANLLGSGFCFGGGNYWTCAPSNTTYLFDPGQTLSAATWTFQFVSGAGIASFYWRSSAGLGQSWEVYISGPGMLATVSIYKDAVAVATGNVALSLGTPYVVTVTDDGTNIAVTVNSLVLMVADGTYNTNTMCGTRIDTMGSIRWSDLTIWH